MAKETGKRRKSRIDLDYYKKPDPVARRRWPWVVGVVAVFAGLLALAPAWGDRDRKVSIFRYKGLANHGALAKVHATWDNQCEACHVPFGKVNGSRWAPALVSTPADENCKRCHAGPPHHANQIASEVAACAECHRDHQGREAAIALVGDATCAECHANLDKHRTSAAGEPKLATEVTAFDATHHPEFAALRSDGGGDQGKLKFNHKLHLAKGLTTVKDGVPFTMAMLAEKDRARYGAVKGQDPAKTAVKLECASCHWLDGGASDGSEAARGGGAYYAPVTYENHCAACHALGFDPADPKLQVRHRQQPADVLTELKRLYAAEVVRSDPKLLEKKLPATRRPLPGKPAEPEPPSFGEAVDGKVATAVRLLFGSHVDETVREREKLPQGRRGCVECHELSPAGVDLAKPDALRNVNVVEPNLPDIWFKHARFDHTAHRALECAACHVKSTTSELSRDLLLPGRATCLECHGPGSSSAGMSSKGTAGNTCVECHRYHQGDQPRHGLGSAARGVARESALTIDQFLSGGRNP